MPLQTRAPVFCIGQLYYNTDGNAPDWLNSRTLPKFYIYLVAFRFMTAPTSAPQPQPQPQPHGHQGSTK